MSKQQVHITQQMVEKHFTNAGFTLVDIGIAYDATHVWVCINGISVFRAKIAGGGEWFCTFDNLDIHKGTDNERPSIRDSVDTTTDNINALLPIRKESDGKKD